MTDHDTMNPVPTPVHYDTSPTPAQMAAGLRQVLLSLAAATAALGMSGAADKLGVFAVFVLTYSGVIGGAMVFVWGQIATRMQAKKLFTLGELLPNSKAKAK